MAIVQLLGEQVNTRREVDERTAFAVNEILVEQINRDKEFTQAPEEATYLQIRSLVIAIDRNRSGSDWIGLMEAHIKVNPDMSDPETRKAFVKIAALALAALRAS